MLNQQTFNVVTANTLANSKAFVFVLNAYTELVNIGHADCELAFDNTNLVTYAEHEGKVIGSCVWMMTLKRSVWILFSAVDKDWRRMGVYTAMLNQLDKEARQAGAVTILSGVHVNNVAMIAAAVKHGRAPKWIRMKKDLYADR